MTWGATHAKAKFSEVLDKAEAEGPQLVRRRKRDFYVMTREQREAEQTQRQIDGKTEPFVSGWEMLTPSTGVQFNIELAKRDGKVRVVNF